MKYQESSERSSFKGFGFLIGALITVVIGTVVFVLSKDFVIAISASLPIGFSIGVGLEQKARGEDRISQSGIKYLAYALLAIGILLLIAIMAFS